MNNVIFWKIMKSVKKCRDIKLVIIKTRRCWYQTIIKQFFCWNFISSKIEKKSPQAFINELVYLGLSILKISKIVLYEIWYDYKKPKYGEKAKLCYMDTDNFIVYVKTEDIAKDVETKFNLSLI